MNSTDSPNYGVVGCYLGCADVMVEVLWVGAAPALNVAF
jgi:hypothetical protein